MHSAGAIPAWKSYDVTVRLKPRDSLTLSLYGGKELPRRPSLRRRTLPCVSSQGSLFSIERHNIFGYRNLPWLNSSSFASFAMTSNALQTEHAEGREVWTGHG